jgi:hypothetical protein
MAVTRSSASSSGRSGRGDMCEFCGFCGDVGGALARPSDEGKGREVVVTGGDRQQCFLLHSIVIPCREARVWAWDVEVTSAQTRGEDGLAERVEHHYFQ